MVPIFVRILQNDPAETVNRAGQPESKAVVEALSKHLPPLAPAEKPAHDRR